MSGGSSLAASESISHRVRSAPATPAAGVSGVERTLWLIDKDAASLLPPDLLQRGRI